MDEHEFGWVATVQSFSPGTDLDAAMNPTTNRAREIFDQWQAAKAGGLS